MQTELPTLLNVCEADYELQYSERQVELFMTGNYEIAWRQL